MSADRAAAYMAMTPEQRAANDRKRLGSIRRAVGAHVAQAMLGGDLPRRQAAWALASELDAVDCEIEYPIRNSLKAFGADYDQVWVEPAPGLEPPVNLSSLRYALARHIAGAYTSGSDQQHARAQELATGLDSVGLNVDHDVDRLILAEMRRRPSDRGTDGRADNCPF